MSDMSKKSGIACLCASLLILNSSALAQVQDREDAREAAAQVARQTNALLRINYKLSQLGTLVAAGISVKLADGAASFAEKVALNPQRYVRAGNPVLVRNVAIAARWLGFGLEVCGIIILLVTAVDMANGAELPPRIDTRYFMGLEEYELSSANYKIFNEIVATDKNTLLSLSNDFSLVLDKVPFGLPPAQGYMAAAYIDGVLERKYGIDRTTEKERLRKIFAQNERNGVNQTLRSAAQTLKVLAEQAEDECPAGR